MYVTGLCVCLCLEGCASFNLGLAEHKLHGWNPVWNGAIVYWVLATCHTASYRNNSCFPHGLEEIASIHILYISYRATLFLSFCMSLELHDSVWSSLTCKYKALTCSS